MTSRRKFLTGTATTGAAALALSAFPPSIRRALAIPAGERQFSELGGHRRIAAGSTLPAPSPVFPRYVDSEASAQT